MIGTETETDVAGLAAELRRVEMLSDMPEDEMRSLAAAGSVVRRARGDVSPRQGDPADFVFILLEGEVRVTRQVNGHEEVLVTYGPHTLFGEIPVLMGDEQYWASGRAMTECRVFELPKAAFWELVTSCPELCGIVLRQLARRLAALEAVSQGRARMVSLGTFAAGLAHELNNPASAARRATAELTESIHEIKGRSIAMARVMADEELMALAEIYDEAIADAAQSTGVSRLSDEDECAEWLEAHGVSEAWSLAPSLTDAGLCTGRLDRIAERVPHGQLEGALRWLEVRARTAAQVRTAADAAARVADVVSAVKGYTLLGQAPLLEVDVNEGLESTIAVLRPRLAAIVVEREYDEALPRIRAWGSELNQVWTALLENCADVLRDGGHVHVSTRAESGGICVRVEDDGPGIPEEIHGRVFDPFFTTKDVGEGPGLGLAGAYRIVTEHGGAITFDTRPGRTRFEVRLPLEPPLPGE